MTVIQKLIILLAVALSVALYFAPKHATEETSETAVKNDFLSSVNEWKKTASETEQKIFSQLEFKLKSALSNNNEISWLAASEEFLRSARFIQGNRKAILYKEAISGYEKALSLNPDNLSVKTQLGAAIVEGSSFLGMQPMQGISLLKEVIQKDSNNLEANFQLGLFSLTSHQFEKAIDRFKRVLQIDSTRIEVYVYLGDTYHRMGKKDKAIESYENYKQKVNDTLIKKDIDEYIKKLKQQP